MRDYGRSRIFGSSASPKRRCAGPPFARSDISQKLCLRQNQLSSLLVAPADADSPDAPSRPLESLTALRDLDLYDNRLTSVDGLATLSELECARS